MLLGVGPDMEAKSGSISINISSISREKRDQTMQVSSSML